MKLKNAALVLLGIALLILSFAEEQPESGQERAKPLPNLTLASIKGGEEALRELRALHGGSPAIELEDALIAEYIASDGRFIKVWVGVARDETAAREMLTQMRTKIKRSGIFTPGRSLQIGGVEVFTASGFGGQHYYYAKGNRVVWIEGRLSREGLRALVENLDY